MPRVDKYHFGWICQFDIEYVAARAFLDENHDEPNLPPNDTNTYTLGKMGQHNVVIAVSGKRAWGPSTVAISATHMLRSFPKIKNFLFVTMGGGAPNDQDDIRLGDIVVSESRGGDVVFQFDHGLTVQDRGLIPERSPTTVPILLQTAVNRLKDRYRIGPNRLKDSINSILDTHPTLREYRRPDPGSDILFASDFVNGRLPYTGSCFRQRPERTAHKDNTAIHYGQIASGNRFIKDAAFRDEMSCKESVLCFEVGAAGVMNDFPCLVICGICDYSDTHRPKVWDRYAAMAAAAYAKDLLSVIPDEDGKKIDGTFSRKTMKTKSKSKIHSSRN